MRKVKTKVGEVETPDIEDIGPRTKYWAEAVQDLVRVDELYCVLGAALQEAYNAGQLGAMSSFMSRFQREVIDVEARVVEESVGKSDREAGLVEQPAEGSEPEGSDVPGAGGRPVEQADGSPDVPGRDAEGTLGVGGDEA